MRIILLVIFLLSTFPSYSGEIISKDQTDYIFTLNRNQWETYVTKIVLPSGWKKTIIPIATGTSATALDPDGYGLSIQPIYTDSSNPPMKLIVGSYYPPGVLPKVNDKYLNKFKSAIKEDLGGNYIVSVREYKQSLIGFEITVMKK